MKSFFYKNKNLNNLILHFYERRSIELKTVLGSVRMYFRFRHISDSKSWFTMWTKWDISWKQLKIKSFIIKVYILRQVLLFTKFLYKLKNIYSSRNDALSCENVFHLYKKSSQSSVISFVVSKQNALILSYENKSSSI